MPRNRPAILLVDDDDVLRGAMRRVLQGAGYDDVLEAGTVRAAEALVARATESTFAAAVLDLELPDGSGLDIVDLLIERHPDCGVVLISGARDANAIGRAARVALGCFMAKPFDRGDLLAAVSACAAADSVETEKEV